MPIQYPLIKNWLPAFVSAVLCYFAGRLTLSLPSNDATAIWVPAGIGLGAVLLWGYRVLPAIFLAELLLHYQNDSHPISVEPSLQWLVFFLTPVNSVFRSWLGCVLVKKYAGYPNALISTPLIVRFFILAGPVATFLPALLNVYGFTLIGNILEQRLVFYFLTQWMGDCTGIFIFTPLFFMVFDRSHSVWQQRLLSMGIPLLSMLVIIAVSYLVAQHYQVERLGKIINPTAYYSNPVGLLLAGGLFLTGFISIGLLMLTGQNESARAKIDKQSQALKKSSKRHIASTDLFRKMVQTQTAIAWRADPDTLRFVFVSDEAERLLGYPPRQWLNEVDFCQQHIHEDDRDFVVAAYKDIIRNQHNHEVEFRIIAADGHCVWVRNFIDITKENGKVTGLFGFMIDITRQKQTEEQLRLAATTFESQQGIMITDKDSKILRVNKAFTEITGYSQEQVQGRDSKILSSGQHDPLFYQELWKQLQTYGRFEGEIWNRRKNGEIYPEWQTIAAVKNDAGEVSHYVHLFSDITEKKDAESKIHAMAFYDPLTQLPNRRLLLDRFDQELASARRHRQYGAVIFLDVDHFKLLNDLQGHRVGDQLLIQFANRLASVLREEDTPARLGGDEFIVLLHATSEHLNTAADQAWAVAEKIKDTLSEPFMIDHYQHRISTSIGITLFPDNHESPDILLQQADAAMYRSKASGRNTVSFFHSGMQKAADLRLTLEQDLRAAIENNQFMLCYQPQVDAEGAAIAAEALIRWKHREKGLLLPKDFIPVAEESSLILALGRWALMEACNQIKIWQNAGIKLLPLSVNISSRQFRQQDFVNQVKSAIDTSKIAPHLLGIELTESELIVDITDTTAKIKALKALGISITVDNFGTGYSSLMYLKQLPIDTLKIDREIIKDILTDANHATVVETIIAMARHLNINVVAKGVETAEQLALLKHQGCTAFQGYYFSTPSPATDYSAKYL